MIKEFIPYEQALELKALGFNEPCFGNWQDMKEETPWFSKSYADNQNQYYGQLCSAPTFSQAFRWFREKYNAYIVPKKFDKTKWWVEWGDWTSPVFETFEEAELACLKKLIEIVKND